MQGLVTVFGASGFIGAQVVRALARRGVRIRAAMRNPGRGYKLRMLGDVGQIEVVQANIRMPASIDRALDGAQACVNLVGVLHEHGRQRFQSIHGMGAQNLAEAGRAAGVQRFVHVSAIGAAPDALSKYARSKAAGEAAVRERLKGATILRPSIVFGPGDDFFNRFARMATHSPVLPLIGGGATRFQPVYVGDVAQALATCVLDPATAGKTYELGGPSTHTFRALMEMVLAETERRCVLVPVPFPLAALIGMAGDLQSMLMKPVLTSDQVASLRTDNVVGPDAKGLSDLGLTPTALESVLTTYLWRYRKGGQYADLLEAR